MAPTIPLDALIAWADEEARNWQDFFRTHPQALDLKTDIAHTDSVRGLLAHIAGVEYVYTERIRGIARSNYDELRQRANADPFALGDEARRWFREFLASGDDAALDTIMTFGTLTVGQFSATRSKMLAHAMLHSIRHWAQLATFIRQQGLPEPGKHDFLYTAGMK